MPARSVDLTSGLLILFVKKGAVEHDLAAHPAPVARSLTIRLPSMEDGVRKKGRENPTSRCPIGRWGVEEGEGFAESNVEFVREDAGFGERRGSGSGGNLHKGLGSVLIDLHRAVLSTLGLKLVGWREIIGQAGRPPDAVASSIRMFPADILRYDTRNEDRSPH
jgi:hypothetical protein